MYILYEVCIHIYTSILAYIPCVPYNTSFCSHSFVSLFLFATTIIYPFSREIENLSKKKKKEVTEFIYFFFPQTIHRMSKNQITLWNHVSLLQMIHDDHKTKQMFTDTPMKICTISNNQRLGLVLSLSGF